MASEFRREILFACCGQRKLVSQHFWTGGALPEIPPMPEGWEHEPCPTCGEKNSAVAVLRQLALDA